MGSSNARIKRQHRAKWRRWIRDLEDPIQDLVISRKLYEDLGEIVKANAAARVPADFHVWLAKNYAVSIAVGVRRLLDEDADSLSVARLLTDIRAHNKSITRRSHRHWMRRAPVEVSDAHFDELAGSGSAFLPKHEPAADLSRLKKAGAATIDMVNKRIAHMDIDGRTRRRRLPRFKDTYAAIDEIEAVYLKYRALLTGKSSDSLLPVWVYDWTSIFEHPWKLTGGTGE